MTSSQEQPARRLSAFFSLSRNSSSYDLNEKQYSPSPSLRPLPVSRDPSPGRLQHLSNPRLRSSSSAQNFSRPSSQQSPFLPISLGPAFNGLLGDDDVLLPPPRIAQADPTAPGSPTGSRPGSSAGSRPASPSLGADLLQPATPPTSESKLHKRRSWMLGKSRSESQVSLDGSHTFGAWVIGAQGEIPYDVKQLVTASKVCSS